MTEAAASEPSPATSALIDRLFAAINARDVDALAQISTPDFEWRDPDGLPGGGLHRGAEAIIARVRELDESFEELRFAAKETLEAGERVLVTTLCSGRGRESGVPTAIEFFGIYRISGGRFAAMTACFDRVDAEEAFRAG